MKKTTISLATLALSASASAFVGPISPNNIEVKTYCLHVYEDANGSKTLGGCDESNNNHQLHRPLNGAGCAAGQAALTATRVKGSGKPFSPHIRSCLPPNVAQL